MMMYDNIIRENMKLFFNNPVVSKMSFIQSFFQLTFDSIICINFDNFLIEILSIGKTMTI